MTRSKAKPFAPEVRERAVRLVLEHQGEYPTQWAAITSIAGKRTNVEQTLKRHICRRLGHRKDVVDAPQIAAGSTAGGP